MNDILLYGIPIALTLVIGYNYFNHQATNALYRQLKSLNNEKQKLKGKNILVVGGTQGIGMGIAIRAAELGASVVIAARNRELANSVLNRMDQAKISDKQSFKFLPVDASLMSDLQRFDAQDYFESIGGLDHIFITSGTAPNFWTVDKTSEGNDANWMVTGYSKYFITKSLAPILKGSCTYVLRPSYLGSLDLQNMENHNTSFIYRMLRILVFVDSITLDFQRQFPHLKFFHLFPGPVITNLAQNNNLPMHFLFDQFLKMTGRDPVDYADHPIYVATTPDYVGGKRYWENDKPCKTYAFLEDTKNLDAVRQWSKDFEARYINKHF